MNIDELTKIMDDDKPCEELIDIIYSEMQSDEEAFDKKGRSLIRAFINNDVNGALMALSGWSMDTLISKAKANIEPIKEPVSSEKNELLKQIIFNFIDISAAKEFQSQVKFQNIYRGNLVDPDSPEDYLRIEVDFDFPSETACTAATLIVDNKVKMITCSEKVSVNKTIPLEELQSALKSISLNTMLDCIADTFKSLKLYNIIGIGKYTIEDHHKLLAENGFSTAPDYDEYIRNTCYFNPEKGQYINELNNVYGFEAGVLLKPDNEEFKYYSINNTALPYGFYDEDQFLFTGNIFYNKLLSAKDYVAKGTEGTYAIISNQGAIAPLEDDNETFTASFDYDFFQDKTKVIYSCAKINGQVIEGFLEAELDKLSIDYKINSAEKVTKSIPTNHEKAKDTFMSK